MDELPPKSVPVWLGPKPASWRTAIGIPVVAVLYTALVVLLALAGCLPSPQSGGSPFHGGRCP